MKILIVTTEIGPNGGGLSLACSRLFDILSTKHDVHVLSSTEYPIVIAKGGYSSSVETGIRKENKLKSDLLIYEDVDAIIGFGGGFNGYYASILARRLNKKYILALRGSDINIAKWSVEEIQYLAESCRIAKSIICLSEEMRTNVLSVCPMERSKVIIIPNGIIGSCKEVSFPNLPHKLTIGCAASHLNEKKGLGNLFCMVYEYKKISDKPISFEVVGDIDNDLMGSYQSLIEQLGLQENVAFYKKMSRDELKCIMKNWDFYVQGSICEGHPNSVIESLQEGVAFISSPTGFIAECLRESIPDIFFDNWFPKDMANKLEKLSCSGNLLSSYNKARQILEEKCNYDYVAQSWLSLFSPTIPIHRELEIEHVTAVALHDIQGETFDSITTPTRAFRDFVKFIFEHGYKLCSMKEFLESSATDRRSLIVCTFDDGYSNLANTAVRILSEYGFSATAFVCTGLIGKENDWNNKDSVKRKHLNLEEIKTLLDHNWEIASHGVLHRNLLKLNDLDLDRELSESKLYLENLVGYSNTFSYPYGANNPYIQQCTAKYYNYAFAVSQGGTSLVVDKMQIKRYSITELYQMIL